MAETVVGAWSKDLSQMESKIGQMQTEATQRWKDNLDALSNAFNSFEAKFKSDISNLEDDTLALEIAFEEFAKEFKKDIDEIKRIVEGLFLHIWGTQAEKEAWQSKISV